MTLLNYCKLVMHVKMVTFVSMCIQSLLFGSLLFCLQGNVMCLCLCQLVLESHFAISCQL